jgi:hypothetical protein
MTGSKTDGYPLAATGHAGKTPEPGRCVYCDQRCDTTSIHHGYCLELHGGIASPSLLSRLISENIPPPETTDSSYLTIFDEFSEEVGGVTPSAR